MSEDIFTPCMQDLSPLPDDTVPTMAYVPFQQMGDTYEVLKAFECGTLFPVLNKPFSGKRGENN